MQTGNIDAALGGSFLSLFWHNTGRMGAMIEGYRRHIIGSGHFQVEWDPQAIA